MKRYGNTDPSAYQLRDIGRRQTKLESKVAKYHDRTSRRLSELHHLIMDFISIKQVEEE